MNSIYKANLLIRISIFKDLASVDVDHTKITYMNACCGDARVGPIPLRIKLLNNKRRDFSETARRLQFDGHVQIGMMDEDLVPTSVQLAQCCHYKEVLLDKFLFTRVDTEVVIVNCGEEHQAHRVVEKQVVSSDDVIDENIRINSDEDNCDTQVKDTTLSSSSTPITGGSSSSLLTPPNCLNRVVISSWTASSATEVHPDILGFSFSGWRILGSSGRRIGIIRCIAGNSVKVDSGTSDHAKKCKLHIDIALKFSLADATATPMIISGTALSADEQHVAARSTKQHFDSVDRDD